MATKSKRHTHKYYKMLPSPGARPVWACALGDCNHHMPPHYENFVIGKDSICWKCGERFTLDRTNMNRDKPICDECALPGISGIVENPFMIEAEQRLHRTGIDHPESEIPPQAGKKLCSKCGKREVAGDAKVCIPCFMAQ